VSERIAAGRGRLRNLRLGAGGEIEQCFGGFRRQVASQLQNGVFVGRPDVLPRNFPEPDLTG
jgi:hypothetical protein